MGEPTDLQPAPRRTDDERRAAAGLRDVARPVRSGEAPGGGPGPLAGIQRRAARRHRRRVAGAAAATVAAVAAVGLVVPAVLPGGGRGIAAPLGLDRGPAPSPDAQTLDAPSTFAQGEVPTSTFLEAGDSMMLTDAQVEAFVTGVQGRAPGALGNDNANHLPADGPSLTVGGWCRDADLPVRLAAPEDGVDDLTFFDRGPFGRWSATWRADALARGSVGVDVDEGVVKWAFDRAYPSASAAARSYVDGTGASSVRCRTSAGRDLAGDFRVLTPPMPGAVQAVAPVEGASGTWEVRTVASADGSGAAVDLTVVLAAPTAQEAGRAVVPLLRQALERVTAREAVERAASEAGTEPQAPPSSTAPERVVARPYGLSRTGSSLTLDQVAAVLPGVVSELRPQGADNPSGSGCVGHFRVPGVSEDSNATSESVSGFEIENDGGTTTVAEWLFSWTASGPRSGSLLFGLDPPCGPAPAGETWEPVTLSHGGTDVRAIVRHPDGDPRRWIVRVTGGAEPAAAVGLEIEMTASSQDDVAAVVVPLLEAAQQRAYDANFVPSAS